MLRERIAVVCPLCRKFVGEIKRDAWEDGRIVPERITRGGKKLKEGDEVLCPYCEFPCAIDIAPEDLPKAPPLSVVYTEYGWLPKMDDMSWLSPSLPKWLKKWGRWKSEWDKLEGNLLG